MNERTEQDDRDEREKFGAWIEQFYSLVETPNSIRTVLDGMSKEDIALSAWMARAALSQASNSRAEIERAEYDARCSLQHKINALEEEAFHLNNVIARERERTQQASNSVAVQEPIYQVRHSDGLWADTSAARYKAQLGERRIVYAHPITSQVPEGYKLVPIEPTEAMLMAASSLDNDETLTQGDIYKAMLAAAPTLDKE